KWPTTPGNTVVLTVTGRKPGPPFGRSSDETCLLCSHSVAPARRHPPGQRTWRGTEEGQRNHATKAETRAEGAGRRQHERFQEDRQKRGRIASPHEGGRVESPPHSRL